MILKIFVGFAAATLATAAPSLYGDAERGAALFQAKNCVNCHSINGQGARTAPDLGKRGGEDFTPSSLAAMLWNHAPSMWGALSKSSTKIELTAQDSADLFAYFYAARYMDPPGDASRGKHLFAAKHCASCHALDGSGAEGTRPGLHWESLADPIELARQMWNHAPAMRAAMAKKGLAPPTLTPAEMNDILVYLRTQPKARENRPVFQPASAETGAMLFQEKGCVDCHKGNLSMEQRATFGSVSQVAAAMWNHSSSMKQSSETPSRGDEAANRLHLGASVRFRRRRRGAWSQSLRSQGLRLVPHQWARAEDRGDGARLLHADRVLYPARPAYDAETGVHQAGLAHLEGCRDAGPPVLPETRQVIRRTRRKSFTHAGAASPRARRPSVFHASPCV